MKKLKFDIIGAEFGWGGKYHDPYLAVQILDKNGFIESLQKIHSSLNWSCRLTEKNEYSTQLMPYKKRVEAVADFGSGLAKEVMGSANKNNFPIIIGGDHSIAIGTWSGMVHAFDAFKNFGLIWMDAHMDAHTPQTSESHAICGMPVAALMGYGESSLVNLVVNRAKLAPQHIVLIGVRSFECGEAELLKKLNVTVYFMSDIQKNGFKTIFKKAVEQVTNNTKGFGISIDLDAFDPTFAPGVGYPEPNGLEPEDVLQCLNTLRDNAQFKALEITEYNPTRDVEFKTAKLVQQLVASVI